MYFEMNGIIYDINKCMRCLLSGYTGMVRNSVEVTQMRKWLQKAGCAGKTFLQ